MQCTINTINTMNTLINPDLFGGHKKWSECSTADTVLQEAWGDAKHTGDCGEADIETRPKAPTKAPALSERVE